MSVLSRFLWLMSQMTEFFFYGWPITLTLLVLSGGSFVGWLRRKHRPRLKLVRLTSCLVLPDLILLCGAIFYSKSGQYSHPYAGTGIAMILGLLLAQLSLSILFVVRAHRGARLLSACILACEFFVSLAAAVLALLSISGTWF